MTSIDMLRRNMRSLTPKTDNLFRGMRQRRVSHLNAAPSRQFKYSTTILEESVTELNDMVEKIGNINLDKNSETTESSESNPQPSATTCQPSVPTSQSSVSATQSSVSSSQTSSSSTTQSSVSGTSRKSSGDSSPSTMDVSEEPAPMEKLETTLMWTMALMVHDGNSFRSIRGALGSESQHHIITEKCRRKLKLPLLRLGSSTPPVPPVQTSNRKILGKTVITFSSYFNRKRVYTLEAVVVDKICSRSPSMITHPSIKKQLDFFKLADPNFDIPAAIDLIIGSGLYPALIKGRPCFVLGKSCSVLQSILGWVVGGKVPIDEFQPNKTKDESSDKISKTVKEVERYMSALSPPA